MLSRNLLRLRQAELVSVLIEDEHLLGPGLVDLAGEDLSDLVGVLVVEIGLLDVHDPSLKVLADIENAPSSEILELHLSRECLSEFVVVSFLIDFRKGNLGVRILDGLHDFEILVDLAVSLVHVDDDVEVVSRTESLGQLGHEYVLEHSHHHRTVNVLFVLEKCKRCL